MSDPRLKSFIERIERVNEEIKALQADVREIFAEAKSSGFCPKTMRKVIALRKLSDDERAEQEAMLDTYVAELEGIKDLPLGQAAVKAAKVETAEKVRAKRVEPAEPLLTEPDVDDVVEEYRAKHPNPNTEPVSERSVHASADDLDIPTFMRRELPEDAPERKWC